MLSKNVVEGEQKGDNPNSSPVMSSEAKDMVEGYRHKMKE